MLQRASGTPDWLGSSQPGDRPPRGSSSRPDVRSSKNRISTELRRSGDGAPLHESARRPVVGHPKAVVEILRISSGSGTGARRAGQHRARASEASGVAVARGMRACGSRLRSHETIGRSTSTTHTLLTHNDIEKARSRVSSAGPCCFVQSLCVRVWTGV